MTEDKDPIDPTSTEGDISNADKPAKPSDTNPSTFSKIRNKLTPSSSSATEELEDEETAEEIDQERRRAMYAAGTVAGAAGLGVGAIAGQQYQSRQEDAAAPAIVDDDNDEPVDIDNRMESYMQLSEMQEIPGPVEGEAYRVKEGLLREFNETAWEDMAAESEYQDLGTGTEWYLQEDGTIVGVNERQQISRTFDSEEFEYNQEFTELYDELEAMD